jgi:hypothetical protein
MRLSTSIDGEENINGNRKSPCAVILDQLTHEHKSNYEKGLYVLCCEVLKQDYQRVFMR